MRAALVIGINQVSSGLQKLSAASSGATEVADWLKRNDYQVDLFVDDRAPVERSSIFKAVKRLTDASNVERLVIYFAGHGFLKGPLDEYWLLSGAPTDAAEAVNVTLSSAMARYKGIPQIIFISDACRVVPKTGVHSGIVGASIFPNTPPKADSADIDFYYATLPGDPALERGDTEAAKAHGLFTQELLNAHKGAPPEALLSILGRDYVRNRWLKKVLRDRVDLRAQSISLALTQKPDVQLQIIDGYIGRNETSDSTAPAPLEPFGVGFTKGSSTPGFHAGGPAIVEADACSNSTFQARADRFRESEQRTAITLNRRMPDGSSSEWLICQGGKIEEVSATPGVFVRKAEFPEADSSFRFRLENRAAQIALRFDDGTGMLLPVLREYSCEILRHKGRVSSVAYTWNFYRDSQLADLRAQVLSAATLGLLSRSREAVHTFAREIRQAKRMDPILGVVAALAYAITGDLKGAGSVRNYMLSDLGVDLFDPWLLGGAASGPPPYPSLPLLSQTWSFLEAFNAEVPEDLKRLPRIPGFWTVFEADAMETVFQIASARIRKGVLWDG